MEPLEWIGIGTLGVEALEGLGVIGAAADHPQRRRGQPAIRRHERLWLAAHVEQSARGRRSAGVRCQLARAQPDERGPRRPRRPVHHRVVGTPRG